MPILFHPHNSKSFGNLPQEERRSYLPLETSINDAPSKLRNANISSPNIGF